LGGLNREKSDHWFSTGGKKQKNRLHSHRKKGKMVARLGAGNKKKNQKNRLGRGKAGGERQMAEKVSFLLIAVPRHYCSKGNQREVKRTPLPTNQKGPGLWGEDERLKTHRDEKRSLQPPKKSKTHASMQKKQGFTSIGNIRKARRTCRQARIRVVKMCGWATLKTPGKGGQKHKDKKEKKPRGKKGLENTQEKRKGNRTHFQEKTQIPIIVDTAS